MISSIMQNKTLKKVIFGVLVGAFWVGIWWIFALIVNNSYFLPSPLETLLALLRLFSKPEFYKVASLSLLRVIFGLLLGVLTGILLAVLCHRFVLPRRIFTPIISVIKAMPVATFILILWITLRGSALSVFVGFMMVLPIIYQNLLDGYDSIDKSLIEVTEVFNFSKFKRFKLLTLPTLYSYFCPALITSIGLAFKAQIAAEIIAYTNNSIGQFISDAKYNLQTDDVFAWATVIVSFSIILEFVSKKLLRRLKYES